MPGLYSRLKTWVTLEDLTAANLNAEFDNILTNFVPLMIDDYSTNVSQMQVKTDPGEVGSESLATTLAGELARIRHMITEITGKTHWYQSPSDSLAGLASALGTALADNRLVSGKVRSTSEQPIFLNAHGAARTVTLKGASTNFLYYVDGTQYTISADVTLTPLTAAPSSNNTCLINDTNASDQFWTKFQGENGTDIPVDTMGTEISALIGKYAAFSLNNGSDTEYFIAKVASATSLVNVRRGFFFDSSDNPKVRVVYSNNDTITLLKLTWIFAKSDGTLTATYTNPTYSETEPSSPSNGDYWYDLENTKWMKYDVSAFVAADATLVGVCCQDTSNTIGARSFEFFKSFTADNTVELYYDTAAQLISRNQGSQINVWGTNHKVDQNHFTWSMTTDLDSGVTEGASTYYYFYITEDGDTVISDIRPYDRREDLLGYYHPHQSWRCVGSAYNDGSSDLGFVNTFYSRVESRYIGPSETLVTNVEPVQRIVHVDGTSAAHSKFLPPAASWKGQYMTFTRVDDTWANAVTLDWSGSENMLSHIASKTTYLMHTKGQTATFYSDGTQIVRVNHVIPSTPYAVATHTPGAVTTPPTLTTGVTYNKYRYWREGAYLIVSHTLETLNGGGSNGSGVYLWTLPNSAAAHGDYEFGAVGGNYSGGDIVANGFWYNSSVANNVEAWAFLYDANRFFFLLNTNNNWGSAYGTLNNGAGTVSCSFEARIRIVGWEG